jgi:translation initiation factor 6
MQENFPGIEIIETFINGSAVVGSYIAMNSKGMIVPGIITDDELENLQNHIAKTFMITVLDAEDNAFGNLILCNDHGAIISPKLIDYKEIISKTLQVPVKVMEFANSQLPGACGLANNKGVLVHPMVNEVEAEIISEVLKVDIDISTINCGIPFLGGGAVVNDNGGLFGRESTGPEIQRIMEILQLE